MVHTYKVHTSKYVCHFAQSFAQGIREFGQVMICVPRIRYTTAIFIFNLCRRSLLDFFTTTTRFEPPWSTQPDADGDGQKILSQKYHIAKCQRTRSGGWRCRARGDGRQRFSLEYISSLSSKATSTSRSAVPRRCVCIVRGV